MSSSTGMSLTKPSVRALAVLQRGIRLGRFDGRPFRRVLPVADGLSFQHVAARLRRGPRKAMAGIQPCRESQLHCS
jgi:hypothetical protein